MSNLMGSPTQSDSSEAQTRNPSISSQVGELIVYHKRLIIDKGCLHMSNLMGSPAFFRIKTFLTNFAFIRPLSSVYSLMSLLFIGRWEHLLTETTQVSPLCSINFYF